jgi:ribosomal protein S18 acetylase RimI-like enzyme
MEIRRMRDEDLEAVARLYLAAYGVDWSLDGAQKYIEKFYRFEPASCFVAAVDGGVSGAVLGFSFEREMGLVLFIQELCVHPDQRNQGIGKKLVTTLRESFLKSPSRVAIKPLVKADTHVFNFYNSLGFEKDKAVSFSFDE